jgi:hypothetical protein
MYVIIALFFIYEVFVLSPHPGRIQLIRYLKNDHPWKSSFVYKFQVGDQVFCYEFTALQVDAAKRWASRINPEYYRVLMYLVATNRTRRDIADSLFLDTTTLRRRADKCLNNIMQYLVGTFVNLEDFDSMLSPIDIGIQMGDELL